VEIKFASLQELLNGAVDSAVSLRENVNKLIDEDKKTNDYVTIAIACEASNICSNLAHFVTALLDGLVPRKGKSDD